VSKRVKLTFASEAERKRVLRACKKFIPYGPEATVMRDTLRYLADNIDSFAPSVTRGAFESPAVPSSHPESPAVTCPDPAPAREQLLRQTDRQKKDLFDDPGESDQAAKVATEIRAHDWRQLKLPKGDTPESYARQLVLTYPDVCTVEMIREAALWVRNNPKKLANRKYLGGFLTNWARNARKGPPARKSTSRRPEPKQVDWAALEAQQPELPEVDDDDLFNVPDCRPERDRR
jgi:hypothetical protein